MHLPGLPGVIQDLQKIYILLERQLDSGGTSRGKMAESLWPSIWTVRAVKQRKNGSRGVFIKSTYNRGTQCMDKELHHAAVSGLCRIWGFCLSYNRDSQTEAGDMQKPNLMKNQEQCSAQQGWQQGAHKTAKEGSRTRGMAGIGAISPAYSPAGSAPLSPAGAITTKPTPPLGCGAGTDPQ